MSNCDVSVIMPLKNMSGHISVALKKILDNNKNISMEFILIDMASNDNTILEAIEVIKSLNLNGCVIQSGESQISAVLNTGINRSMGEFITFEFLGDFCSTYITDFYNFSKKNETQILFAKSTNDVDFLKEDSYNLLTKLFDNSFRCNLNKLFINAHFLKKNNIFVNEDCKKYYHYDLFAKMLILCQDVYSCGKDYKKENLQIENDELNIKPKSVFFEFVDTNIKLYEFAQKKCRNNKLIKDEIRYKVLPNVIMDAVNMLLKEGYKASSIKNSLRTRGYDVYLKIDKSFSFKLNKDIILWKRLSFIYSKLYLK